MKTRGMVIAITVVGMVWQAYALDPAWGKWTQKRDPDTYVVFTPSNITISVHGTQEVWRVVEGTNIVTGLTVRQGDEVLKAGCTIKFNEMYFRIGDRAWALRQGNTMTLPPGVNAPFVVKDKTTNTVNPSSQAIGSVAAPQPER